MKKTRGVNNMTNFDPTTNRIPFKLLTSEEQEALMAWPHGWEVHDSGWWKDRPHPIWSPNAVYRGKPEPSVETYFCNVYDQRCFFGWHDNYDDAVRLADAKNIGIVCIKMVDGKLKDARVAEGGET
jgi:hypothetical protein